MSSWLMRTACQLSIGICILDWPAQSQTSPTRTSCKTTVSFSPEAWLAVIVSVYFLKPPFGVKSVTDQRPSAPAWTLTVFALPESLTLTVAPGAALPQTGTFAFCCRTIWSVNSGLSRIWAWTGENGIRSATESSREDRILFIFSWVGNLFKDKKIESEKQPRLYRINEKSIILVELITSL